MIEFKIESTRYKVATPEKQALVKAYCSKIKKSNRANNTQTRQLIKTSFK